MTVQTIHAMEIKKEFKNMKVLVAGLARSGTGAANLLSMLGANVTITDKKSGSSLKADIDRLDPSIKVITGENLEHLFTEADLIVVSPGIPLSIRPIVKAREHGVPVIGELELAYRVIKEGLLPMTYDPSPVFIGITGTNGKSTVTTLVNLMLSRSGFRTLLGGNIGNALTEELFKLISKGEGLSIEYIVAEISSFQLESIGEFRPKAAAILNITPDHLDRYKSIEEYIDAKLRVLENQQADDFLILNADDSVLMEAANKKLEIKSVNPKTIFFSRKREVEGIYFKDGMIYANSSCFPFPTSHLPLLSQDELRIKGIHNLENAMAASAIALASGCSYEAVADVLMDFSGLEHRMELVEELNGIRFINDSKGTNVGAVVKSLESFDRVVLIMGGLDKGGDFKALRGLIAAKVRVLILLGEAKEKIASALGDITATLFVHDLKEAVSVSLSKAKEGDVVLLSPGCASFDMFADFEDRGRKFKEAVREAVKDKRSRQ
ncbi:MAG: UDP-N-acetylmuramoyl-L-alanine--D-glutamate ligase [Nitrospirota bacterium]